MKALSIQEYIELRDESRERFGVTLHLHDHCTSQYLSSDGTAFDDRYSAYLLNYFDSKKLSATISNDRTGVLILSKGL